MKKGPRFEQDVVEFLRTVGFPDAERRVQGGANDRGDIAGVRGWVLETKNVTGANLGTAMTEAEREAKNAGVTRFTYIKKRRMKSTSEAFAVVPLWLLADLIRETS